MLFTSSASFASPCPLLHFVCRHTPFYAVDFLFDGLGFTVLGWFFFFLPSPDVYKHVSQDLLGYLEVESGRVARGRKIGICQLSLMGKKSHHFADPFLWIAIAA